MANEIIVPIKVETKNATASVDNLGKSFGNLDRTVSKTQEKQADYGKQILHSSVLSQKLSQATGGLSDSLLGAVKGLDMTNLSLKAMKGAIMSTGVGILVIALGELISVLADFFSSQKKSEAALNSMTDAMDRNTQAYDDNASSMERQTKIHRAEMEARGASSKELYEQDKKDLEKRIENNDAFIKQTQSQYSELYANLELSEEDFKKAKDKLDEQNKKAIDESVKLQDDGLMLEISQDKEAHDKKVKQQEDADAKKKALAEKQKQELEQQKQALKTLEQKYADDIENMSDTTAQKKLDRQQERAFEELEKIKLSEKAKAEAVRLIKEDFRIKQEALDKTQDDRLLAMSNQFAKDKEDLLAKTEEDKLNLKIKRDTLALETELATMVGDDAKKTELRTQLDEKNDILVKELAQKRADEANTLKQEKLLKDSEDETLEFETRFEALKQQNLLIDENTALTAEQRLEAHRLNTEAVDALNKQEIASENAKQEAKRILAQTGVDILKTATTLLFGEGKKAQAIQKGLTLTQIGIDTASAFSKLMAGSEASAVATGPGYAVAKPIFYATGVLQILANIAKAKQALSSADSGGGGASGGGGGAVAIPPAPTFNVVGPSGANQIAQSIGGQDQQPLKAYVVGGDVTTQQGLNRNIVSNASIG